MPIDHRQQHWRLPLLISCALLSIPAAFAQLPLARPMLKPRPNYAGDPEAEMSVPELIRHWGYPVETHRTLTEDGYVLVLHRIPHGRNEPDPSVLGHSAAERKPVVLLQHGLLCTSSVWLMNLPHQSAGFLFADAGFDVWMGNSRGNFYSRGQRRQLAEQQPQQLANNNNTRNYSNDSGNSSSAGNFSSSAGNFTSLRATNNYWDFSWDEMARYDVGALVDAVLTRTGQQQLHYVGHSQGNLAMLARLALEPEFGKKLKRFFAIAPVASLAHAKGLFRHMAQRMYSQLLLLSDLLGNQEFLPNTVLSRWLTEFICGMASANPLCENFLFLVSGPDSQQLNKTRIGIYLAHNPAGTSLRNIIHYCQMIRHGRMQHFDFGREENLRRYGMEIPPLYALNRVQEPLIHLFYSDSDWLATEKDVEHFLLKELSPNVVQGVHRLADFNHNDFLWGLRAPSEVYAPIVDEIWRSERHGDQQEPKETAEKAEEKKEMATVASDAFVLLEQEAQSGYGQR